MSEQVTEQRSRRRRRQRDAKKKYTTRTQNGDKWKKEEVDDYGSMVEMMERYGTEKYIWYCAQYPPEYNREEGSWEGYRLDGEERLSYGKKLTKTEWNLGRYKKHKAWISNLRKIDGKRVILVANAPTQEEEQQAAREVAATLNEMEKHGITWSDYEPEIESIVGTNAGQWIRTAPATEIRKVLTKAMYRIIAKKKNAKGEKMEPFVVVMPENLPAFRTAKRTNGKSYVYKRRDE